MKVVARLMAVVALCVLSPQVDAQELSIEGEVCASVDRAELNRLLTLEIAGHSGKTDAYAFACRDETMLLLDGERVVTLEPPGGISFERERAIALTASEYIRWKKVPDFTTKDGTDETASTGDPRPASREQAEPPSPEPDSSDLLPTADRDGDSLRGHVGVMAPRLPLESYWFGLQLGFRYVVDVDLELRYGSADSAIGRAHVLSAVLAVGWQGLGVAVADETGRESFALHLSPSVAAGGVVGFGSPTGDGISSQAGSAVQLEARLALVFSQWFGDVEVEVELLGGLASGLSLLADEEPLLSTTGPFFEMGVGARF